MKLISILAPSVRPKLSPFIFMRVESDLIGFKLLSFTEFSQVCPTLPLPKIKIVAVLEVIDLLISNLQSSTAETEPNKEESTCSKEKAYTDIDRQIDPLTTAKRAEKQIKKLKKGKRASSSTKETRRDSLKPNI